jgi:four helix bundle protein
MATINRFEDLECWQMARDLNRKVLKLSRAIEKKKDYKLLEQIRSSSGSVMDNIAEGFGRGGNKEFIQFLFVARGSASELKSQLYRAADNEYISLEESQKAIDMTDKTMGKISGLISYLKQSNKRGYKSD